MMSTPNQILLSYNIGKVKNVDPINVGLIHQTYQVDADKGNFILQRLHPNLASDQIGEDFLAVTKALKEAGLPAPRAVLNRAGKVLTRDDAHAWRMQTFIKGKTIDKVANKKQAKEAGRIYAEFHKALSSLDYSFKSPIKLHRTRTEFAKLMLAIQDADRELVVPVSDQIRFIAHELPALYLPDSLPRRVIHGDPKISNILFDDDDNAVATIDLDTCNHHTILVDLGDAFRSWCGGDEDDPQNKFNWDIYEAGLDGYIQGAGDMITASETIMVPQAVGCLTLELAARFLADYFNDSYFGWDKDRYKSRREHNLARCRGQIALYKNMQK
ncbi:MAG: phosphotransferase [bacterium]